MSLAEQSEGYSSSVSLRLLIDGIEVDVAQVGPDYIIIRDDAVAIAPGTVGTLVIEVDGRQENHELCFPRGVFSVERASFF